MDKFTIFKDKNGEWRWNRKARNNRIVAQSEGYKNKADAEKEVARQSEEVLPWWIMLLLLFAIIAMVASVYALYRHYTKGPVSKPPAVVAPGEDKTDVPKTSPSDLETKPTVDVDRIPTVGGK